MTQRSFVPLLLVVGGFYLALQLVYVLRFPLIMDEFQFGRTVAELQTQVPYRDFTPYKTVLGFYMQLPALWITSDLWYRLLAVKFEMALITTVVLLVVGHLLSIRYRREAVVLGLALLVTMSTFAERSSELRVDMLTANAGLLGLALFLRRRPFWAGLLTAGSFFISQKGAYYILAAEIAAVATLMVRDRDERSEAFANLVRFNLGAAAITAAYIGGWSLVASPAEVFRTVFVNPKRVALGEFYDIRTRYWLQTLGRNPIYYTLAVVALARAGFDRRERFLFVYAAIVGVLCVWHKQPWPYFFVILIPTLFVLHVFFFDRLLARTATWGKRSRAALIAAILVLGAGLPLLRLQHTLRRDSGFQRSMVTLAHDLTAPGETYVAGVDLMVDRDQADPRVRWLDTPRLGELHEGGPALDAHLLRQFHRSPLKLVVVNYRLAGMPRLLIRYFSAQYAPFWGCIQLYAPRIGTRDFDLKFDGTYLVTETRSPSVRIDGHVVQSGTPIRLGRGRHVNDDTARFRLRFVPEQRLVLDPRYRGFQVFFPNVYAF